MAKISLDKLFASQEILTFVKNLNTELTKTGETIDKMGAKKPLKGTGEDLKKTNDEVEKLNTLSREQIKINKEAAKRSLQVQKLREKKLQQNKKLTKEAIKLNEVRKQEKAELTKVTRAEVVLQKAQKRGVKTIQDMKRQISALNTVRERENLTTKKGQKNYKKLTSQIARAEKQVKKYDSAIGRSQRNVGNYGKALKGLAGAFGIAFAGRMVVDFFRDSLKGYEDQVVAETKLETVLKQRTNATDEQIQKIKDLTAAQQNLGVIGDEIQIAGAQQLSTFVKQTSSVETLIPAMNNLIAQQKGLSATQGDATNIANLMGRALQGQLGSLTRVGISFSKAEGKVLKFGTEEEKAAALAQILTNNVGEANKALAETPIGKMKQLSNVFGDIKEKLGAEFAGVLFVIADKIKKIIDVLSGPNSLSDAFKEIGGLFKGLFKSMGKLIAAFRGTNAEALTVRDVIDSIGKAFKFAAGPTRFFIKQLTKLIEFFAFYVKKGRELLVMLGLLDEATESATEGNISWIPTAEAVADGIEKIKIKTEELTKEQEKAAKAAKKLREENQKAANAFFDESEQIKEVTDALKEFNVELGKDDIVDIINKNAKASFDIAVLDFEKAQAIEAQKYLLYTGNEEERTQFSKNQADELFEFKKTKELEYLTFLQNARLEANAVDQAALDAQIEQVKAALIKARMTLKPPDDDDEGGIIDRGLGKLWEELGLSPEQGRLAAQALNDTLDLIKGALDKNLQEEIDRYDKSIELSDTKISSLEDELKEQLNRDQKGAASTTKAANKAVIDEKKKNAELVAARRKAAQRQKRIALTEATINTALSVTNALSQKPFILGLILAIAAAAKGVAEISKIKSANFAKGTEFVELNGNKPGIDTVNANLTAGERVVPVAENTQMKGFPNKLLPAAVNHYMSLDPYSLNSNNLNFTDTSKLESGVSETNQLLKEIKDKPIKTYHNEKLIKAEYASHIEIYVQ